MRRLFTSYAVHSQFDFNCSALAGELKAAIVERVAWSEVAWKACMLSLPREEREGEIDQYVDATHAISSASHQLRFL